MDILSDGEDRKEKQTGSRVTGAALGPRVVKTQ